MSIYERIREVIAAAGAHDCPACRTPAADLTQEELAEMAGALKWSPMLRAIVAAYHGPIADGLQQAAQVAKELDIRFDPGDAVAWVCALESGPVSKLFLREQVIKRLADAKNLPQAKIWIEALRKPAPSGCLYLLVTNESTGAILEPLRVQELTRTAPSA